MKQRQPFVTYEKIITMVGSADDGEGRKRYRHFVQSGISGMDVTFWEDVRGQAILGADGFVDCIVHSFLSDTKREKKPARFKWA